MGDHGQAHVRGKQFCYEEGLHIPLIIRWPKGAAPHGSFQPGTVSDRLIEAIDLAPTFLDIAGVPRPERMQGQVFLGDRAAPPRRYAFGARDRCDETVFRLRTVRDARYRYIRNFTPERPFLQPNEYKERSYPVWNLLKELDAQGKLTPVQKVLTAPTMPAEELYDLDNDPHEIHNLAASDRPEHRAELGAPSRRAESLARRNGRPGAVLRDRVGRRGQGGDAAGDGSQLGHDPQGQDTVTRASLIAGSPRRHSDIRSRRHLMRNRSTAGAAPGRQRGVIRPGNCWMRRRRRSPGRLLGVSVV